MESKHTRMSREELDKLCESIHDKKEEPKLGKAEQQLSSMTGVTVTGTCCPKKNCKHCFGRGYVGRDSETGGFINCRCTMRKPSQKELDEIEQERKDQEERMNKMRNGGVDYGKDAIEESALRGSNISTRRAHDGDNIVAGRTPRLAGQHAGESPGGAEGGGVGDSNSGA